MIYSVVLRCYGVIEDFFFFLNILWSIFMVSTIGKEILTRTYSLFFLLCAVSYKRKKNAGEITGNFNIYVKKSKLD